MMMSEKRTVVQEIGAGAAWGAVPQVSVVIVNYNGMSDLAECLPSLQQQTYPAAEVIVVDNGSEDGSLELIRREYAWVRLVSSQENLGYSGAINLGARKAKGDYIVVLNMDVVVAPDWLEPLVAFMEAHTEAGAASPKVLLYDAPERINALGQNVHVTGLGFNRRYNYVASVAEEAPVRVSGIHGSAFIFRRELFEEIGGMNEANFMYHEDVDVSWLINLAGYNLYCVPASVIHHKYDLFMNPWKLYYLERNRWALLLATLSWRTLALLLPLLLFTEMMMSAYCVQQGRGFLGAKARAVYWNWQNRKHIRQRRAQIQALRQRTDWQLLRLLRLNYDWDQLLHLAR